MSPSERFELTKWYLDGVAPSGAAFVGYWTQLRWRSLHVTWQSVALSTGGELLHERTCLGSGAPPRWEDGVLIWQPIDLGLAVAYRPLAAPCLIPLYTGPEGSVSWRCDLPAGRVDARTDGDDPIVGLGYAECIRFTLPPWQLPIRELRWGRWIADDGASTLIWIAWHGDAPRVWTVLDGNELAGAQVTDLEVTAGDIRLRLTDRRLLRRRLLGETVARIPGLGHLLPDAMLHLAETKWLARGALEGDARGVGHGHAIVEHAVFG